jgi:hypothetical protein
MASINQRLLLEMVLLGAPSGHGFQFSVFSFRFSVPTVALLQEHQMSSGRRLGRSFGAGFATEPILMFKDLADLLSALAEFFLKSTD